MALSVAVDSVLTYDAEVTEIATTDMKIGPEGRVVIPVSIRRHLGVGPGDNLRFVLHADGRVEIVSPRMLVEALWANNTGGQSVDSAELVRSVRKEDQEVSRGSEGAHSHWRSSAGAGRSTSGLLREMGLSE